MNRILTSLALALLLAFAAHAGEQKNMNPGDKSMSQQKQAQQDRYEAQQKAQQKSEAQGTDGSHPAHEEEDAEERANEGENPN